MTDQPLTDQQVMDEALTLIDIALKLAPEGEGISVSDREYSAEDLAHLRHRLSTIRTACDVANKAIAQEWKEQAYGMQVYDDHKWWVGYNKYTQYQSETHALGFAQWLKEQDVETISKVVSPRSIRVTPIPDVIRDTFLTSIEAGTETLQSKPV